MAAFDFLGLKKSIADIGSQAASLRDQLPGYLVPRLAREIPGEMSKQLLA